MERIGRFSRLYQSSKGLILVENWGFLPQNRVDFWRVGFLYPVTFSTFAGSKLKNNYEQLRDGIHFKSRFV
jgi:hypothetical protein